MILISYAPIFSLLFALGFPAVVNPKFLAPPTEPAFIKFTLNDLVINDFVHSPLIRVKPFEMGSAVWRKFQADGLDHVIMFESEEGSRLKILYGVVNRTGGSIPPTVGDPLAVDGKSPIEFLLVDTVDDNLDDKQYPIGASSEKVSPQKLHALLPSVPPVIGGYWCKWDPRLFSVSGITIVLIS